MPEKCHFHRGNFNSNRTQNHIASNAILHQKNIDDFVFTSDKRAPSENVGKTIITKKNQSYVYLIRIFLHSTFARFVSGTNWGSDELTFKYKHPFKFTDKIYESC